MYWIAFAAIGEEFSFHDDYKVGMPGTLSDNGVCGLHILHFLDDTRPFWINGGITLNKFNTEARPTIFDVWVEQTMINATWSVSPVTFYCLKTTLKAVEFTNQEKDVMRRTGEYYMINVA